jgi:hypothetical protein
LILEFRRLTWADVWNLDLQESLLFGLEVAHAVDEGVELVLFLALCLVEHEV